MKALHIALLIALGSIISQGCHHNKEEHPPDTFPEEGDDDDDGDDGDDGDDDDDDDDRRKRSALDADRELSDFFTSCMIDKTGRVFNSWKSVIDFILRDTRWYSATDEQYCKENLDEDRNSVRCWQSRLDKLLRLDSKLLPKGKECVEEYVWAKEEPYIIRRGKRSIRGVTSNPSTLVECLGITRSKYKQCLQTELLTKINLRRYPSLKDFAINSVEKFVSEHYTSCRITSRHTRVGNIYTENCPPRLSGLPFLPQARNKQCISTVFHEIVKTSSPLYRATTTCNKKYSKDKCQYVTCSRPYQYCYSNTGRCVCNVGYQKNSRGDCVILDQCSLVFCGGAHEKCDPSSGRCVCNPGYSRDPYGICKAEDKCRLVLCRGPNEICDPNYGRCICKTGYTRDSDGVCKILNRCALVFCGGLNEICDPRTGLCACKSGYSRDRNGICREQKTDPCSVTSCGVNERCMPYRNRGYCLCMPGFQRLSDGVCSIPDPCAGKNCGSHGSCQIRNSKGMCVCDAGYAMTGGVCQKIDPCAGISCGTNMECRVGHTTGKAECYCFPNFVRAKQGPGCVKKDPCDGVTCHPNSECVLGGCVCMGGYRKNPEGFCIAIDPCASVTCDTNMQCVGNPMTGQTTCQCLTGYVRAKGKPGCVPRDPCALVKCPEFMNCVVSNGNPECKCLDGYVRSNQGPGCIKEDRCNTVHCPPHSTCSSGECVCVAGYQKDGLGRCVQHDPCKSFCTTNEKCIIEEGRPRCICVEGFQLNEFLECVGSDPCKTVECAKNMECRGGSCFCLPGFEKQRFSPGCSKIDPCLNVPCPPFSDCVDGQCVCQEGYKKNPVGFCLKSDSCDTVTCDEPEMRCLEGKCVCLPGFVRGPPGKGCSKESATWSKWSDWRKCSKSCGEGGIQVRFRTCEGKTEALSNCVGSPFQSAPCNEFPCPGRDDRCISPVRVVCPPNSKCVDGACVCDSGYNKIDNGSCIACPPGKVFKSCPTVCYATCDGSPPPIDQSTCAALCRPDVHCVCEPGFLEQSLQDDTCVKEDECTVSGSWGPWGNWVSCTQTCGRGVQLRSRECQGQGCPGEPTDTRDCNTRPCLPPGQCDSPKEFVACPTKCPKTCENRFVEILCTSGCRDNVQCVCPDGMIERGNTDSSCVKEEECPGLCWPNPCKHGGKCVPVGAYYNCHCEEGYSGKNCQLGCGKFCASNGNCIRGNCVCDAGYVLDGKGGCTQDVPVPQ